MKTPSIGEATEENRPLCVFVGKRIAALKHSDRRGSLYSMKDENSTRLRMDPCGLSEQIENGVRWKKALPHRIDK